MKCLIDWRNSDDPRDVIHRACQALSEGKVVGIPTETAYVAVVSSLATNGVAALQSWLASQPVSSRNPLMVLRTPEVVSDYVLTPPNSAVKLMRRCWPGPVALQFASSAMGGLFPAIPEQTRGFLQQPDQSVVGIRVSASSAIHDILRLMPAPLVMLPEQLPDGTVPREAADLAGRMGDTLEMVLDDGPCRYGEPATVVRVAEEDWSVAEPGVVSERTLRRLSSAVYLFCCTGNTCRSPMAEAMFRKLLSDRLKCSEEELVDRGFLVLSAGIAAAVGAPASREAVELLKEKGVDLRGHESQPLTERLLNQVDQIFTMTHGHREAILQSRPDLADRVQLLSRERTDISDPIGGGRGLYEQCQLEIERHLRVLIDELITLKHF